MLLLRLVMNAALLQWAIVRYRSGNCALLGWLGETASMQAAESFSGELTSVEPHVSCHQL